MALFCNLFIEQPSYLPRRDGKLSWPWCWLYTKMVYPSADSHPWSWPLNYQATLLFSVYCVFDICEDVNYATILA